jgi:hypothetical protein
LRPPSAAGTIAGMINIAILIAAGATIGGALLALLALYNAAGISYPQTHREGNRRRGG